LASTNYPLPAGVPKLGYTLIAFIELLFTIAPAIYLLSSKDRLIATLSLGLKKKHDEAKYYALALVLLASMLIYGTVHNLHRYALTLIPLFWVSARMARDSETAKIALILILTTMLVTGTILFGTWRWYL
jgi:hypothetical protein